jgi:bifunctional non-homologous end joining protein LigD
VSAGLPAPLPARRAGDAWWLEVDGHELRLTNLDKLYWPDEGISKGDLLGYYWNAAPLLLPHLRGRPLTMRRQPDGIGDEGFYQKQAPDHAPDWLPTAPVVSEDGSGTVDFMVVEDLATLLYVVNLGCIELHPLHGRVPDPGAVGQAPAELRPDYAFFDLDPFEPASFADVRQVAKLVKVVLDGLGLRAFAKTSGATGMHVYVPIEPVHSYEEVRALVEQVGRMVVRAWPERATMTWPLADRAGKVFIDHQMNRRGANVACVYSVRPRPGAPVATPLDWPELDADVRPERFTISSVWERFAAGDRFAPVVQGGQTLTGALEALGAEPRAASDPARPARSRGRWARGQDGPRRRAGGQERRGAEAPAPLVEYARRRDFDRTPEPPPEQPARGLPAVPHAAGLAQPAVLEPGPVFTIQQHHARRLHHDVRFEHDGVLVSFAVPKRLPEARGARHLAVRTEDHPMDYLTFSGEIPEGEYGGGQVRLFDLGTYEPLEVGEEKWKVRLHGSRYRGTEYTFVRTHDRNWLCLLSGAPPPRLAAPPVYEPMLAVLVAEAFDDDGWLFEVKWDGHRCLAALDGGTRLTSRAGRDVSGQFPELDGLHHQLAARNAVVDGEVVALDDGGRPSFQRMQDRFHLSPEELARRATPPIEFLAFDLLFLDGEPLVDLLLDERRERLAEVLVEDGHVRLSQALRGDGLAFFEQASALGLEGVVAKRAASPYRPGRRSPDWRKVKALRTQDCVIVGWTPGLGRRAGTLGSLLLAVYDDGWLRYVGNVGTGFTDTMLASLLAELKARETRRRPVEPDPEVRRARWVEPELVCEVEYQEWTRAGHLRVPSFKGVREDKLPEDCRAERPVPR